MAATRALRRSRLPARFADRLGAILRVHGPVVDVRFEFTDLPDVLETLSLQHGPRKRDAVLEVVQRRGNGVVRCLATSEAPITPGMRARRDETFASGRTSADASHAIAALYGHRPRAARGPKLLETGIKAIDVLCPIAAGGTVAIMGEARVGKRVLVQELARRLAGARGGLGVFTFVRLADQPWARQVSTALEVLCSAPDQAFFLAAEEHDTPIEPAELPVDTLIHVSRALTDRRIFPAIDPLRSWSRLLTPARVGRRHWSTAQAVRGSLEGLGGRLPPEANAGAADGALAERAWKLQLYLSQPFFVAQPHTRVEGAWVPRRDALAMCRRILAGRHDETPPEAFWFVGAVPRPPLASA